MTNWIFESIFSAQVYILWYFSACMPKELTMKKDVAASVAGAVAPKKPEFSLIDEDLLKSRIYTIRRVKVMLDADLAEIYGYSTGAFNRQVKNNIEKIDDDFRFQITQTEFSGLISKILISNRGGTRKMPYAFTEQGIYMLMTVLKGEQATAQSKALIRLFKQMKDTTLRRRTKSRPSCSWKISRGIAHCLGSCCERAIEDHYFDFY